MGAGCEGKTWKRAVTCKWSIADSPENVLLSSDDMVYFREVVVGVGDALTGDQVVVDSLQTGPGAVRRRIVRYYLAGNSVDAKRRNDVAGEGIAHKESGAAGIGFRCRLM